LLAGVLLMTSGALCRRHLSTQLPMIPEEPPGKNYPG
jgi:hypothetical protein